MIRGLVRHSAPVMLVAFCVLLFGVLTYTGMAREAAPDVDVPLVFVSTPYPGVSPADVESLVTHPLENELAGLKKLKKMTSVSAEGVSLITLEFEPDIDIADALQRARDRANRAKPDLPDDIEEIEINELSFAEMPILIATLAGADEESLKEIGESLKDEIERISGVLKAELSGGRTRQIRVQVDPTRLGHYGLSLDDVIGAINNENVNIPGGDVAVGDASYLLRVPGEFVKPREIESVAIKRKGDRPVLVSDVARVIDGFADRATYARMNGEVAVSLAVSKRTGANIEAVALEVKRLLAERSGEWPEGVSYRVLGDQSKMISDVVADLENGIITALLLVVAVIMFFMGVRNSLFVAIAIPLSFLLGILVISLFGMTLNMVVLFSLILVLGMLVDNAIVIVENVYRHAEMGKPIYEAAIDGSNEVAVAVAASTATTVAAFLPLVFWSGIMGEFMGYMPKTVIIVLLASLVVAVAVLPVVTSRLMKPRPLAPGDTGDRPLGPVMRMYRSALEFSIRHRYLSAGAGIACLIGSCAAYGELNHGTEFFPDSDPNRAVITVRAADGTDIEATDAIVRGLEGILAAEENVDVYVAEVGVGGSGQNPMQAGGSAGNEARVTVDFLPDPSGAKKGDKLRVEPTPVTVERLRQALSEVPGAAIAIEKENMGPPVGAPIAVEISGEDFHKLGAYAAQVRRQLGEIEGTALLTDDYRVGRPELRLRIDRAAAKRVGASTRAVAGTMRTAVAGTKASALRDGEDEYDIVVEIDPRYKEDLQSVLAMRIPGRTDTSPDTYPVPLSSVARYELIGGTGSVHHIDQQMVVTIEGQIAEGYNENAVRQKVVDWIESNEPPAGIAVRLGGANDEQRESQEFLSRAFLIALFLILAVLVTQFNRFDLPIIILASVVLSMIGVLWGLILTGTAFGVIMTGLGVISLAGVVVNNAIVLLDYVEQLRARGEDMHDALIDAGLARFRPVILTALTTILGLVPMALGISIDFGELTVTTGSQTTQWWGPMAVAVIFGLAFATVLTLVMVPTMYSISEDLRGWPGKLKRKILRRRKPT